MAAELMNCPGCGAPVSADSTQCQYCHSRLAAVACPSCFGMIFAGAKFCSHCGASISRKEVAENARELCPRCQVEMKAIVVGGNHLLECQKCDGVWVDVDALQQICKEREKQAAVLGMPAATPEAAGIERNFHYLPCPVCHQLMNRVNFAHCSNVVLNVCKAHGTWFEKYQLRRMVEFIHSGGLEKARSLQLEQIEHEKQRLAAGQIANLGQDVRISTTFGRERVNGISIAVDLLESLFE